MRVALAGVGRMGSAIAGRLRAAGHELHLYDPVLAPGTEAAASLEEAAAGVDLVFLCLPDQPLWRPRCPRCSRQRRRSSSI